MIRYSVFTTGNVLRPDEATKAYARSQVRETLNAEDLCRKVADRSVYSRGIVTGVTLDISEVLTHELLKGNRVKLGNLGTFGVSLRCEPADSPASFSRNNIKSVGITFTPSRELLQELSQAEFEPVQSRDAQRAASKAKKEL